MAEEGQVEGGSVQVYKIRLSFIQHIGSDVGQVIYWFPITRLLLCLSTLHSPLPDNPHQNKRYRVVIAE